MTYSPAQSYQLFVSFLGATPLAFDPRELPQVYNPIMFAFLHAYLKDPQNVPARHTAFGVALEELTPHEVITFQAYLEEGSIEHHAIRIRLTPEQKNVLRALFTIAPEQTANIADYLLADIGNTHRRLQALVKKELVLRTLHNNKILYHLCPKHFIVPNPFPDPFASLDLEKLLTELTAESEDEDEILEALAAAE